MLGCLIASLRIQPVEALGVRGDGPLSAGTDELGGCNAFVSPLASKLLSIAVLLACCDHVYGRVESGSQLTGSSATHARTDLCTGSPSRRSGALAL